MLDVQDVILVTCHLTTGLSPKEHVIRSFCCCKNIIEYVLHKLKWLHHHQVIKSYASTTTYIIHPGPRKHYATHNCVVISIVYIKKHHLEEVPS